MYLEIRWLMSSQWIVDLINTGSELEWANHYLVFCFIKYKQSFTPTSFFSIKDSSGKNIGSTRKPPKHKRVNSLLFLDVNCFRVFEFLLCFIVRITFNIEMCNETYTRVFPKLIAEPKAISINSWVNEKAAYEGYVSRENTDIDLNKDNNQPSWSKCRVFQCLWGVLLALYTIGRANLEWKHTSIITWPRV